MANHKGPKRVIVQHNTIGQLADGLVGRILDDELRQIHKDIDDRGHDGKARTLTLKLTFLPNEHGVLDIKAQVTKKLPDVVPPRTTAKTSSVFGGFVFNPDCADNPDQMTFAAGGDEGETE